MEPFAVSRFNDTLSSENSSVHSEIEFLKRLCNSFFCKLFRSFNAPACEYFISVMVVVVAAAAFIVVVVVMLMMIVTAAAFVVVMVVFVFIMVVVMVVVTAAALVIVVMMVMFVFIVFVVVMLMLVFMVVTASAAAFIIMMVLMVMVVMMVVFMNSFVRKLFKKLISKRSVALHSFKYLSSRKVVPWSCDYLSFCIMLSEKLNSSLKLVLRKLLSSAEYNSLSVLDLVKIEFTEVLYIHSAFLSICNSYKA